MELQRCRVDGRHKAGHDAVVSGRVPFILII
jgi:hypothetical protein